MALIPSDGAVAFIPQPDHMPTDEKDKAAIDAIIDVDNDDGKRKRWIPVTSMGFSPQQIQDVLPLEIGYPSAMRSGVYKGGVWAAGQMTLIPRIDKDHLHYLFYSLTGSWLGVKKAIIATTITNAIKVKNMPFLPIAISLPLLSLDPKKRFH